MSPQESIEKKLELVLHEKYVTLSMDDGAGDALDAKADRLLQAGSLVIVIFGLINVANLFVQDANPWAFVVLAVATAAFLAMVIILLIVSRPQDFELPGTNDFSDINRNNLEVTTEEAYLQSLANVINSIEFLGEQNQIKARYIRISAILFIVQIVGFMLAMVLSNATQP
jgi:hypothetical protein